MGQKLRKSGENKGKKKRSQGAEGKVKGIRGKNSINICDNIMYMSYIIARHINEIT